MAVTRLCITLLYSIQAEGERENKKRCLRKQGHRFLKTAVLFLGLGGGGGFFGFSLGLFGEFDALRAGGWFQPLRFLGKFLKSIDATG